MFLLLVFALSYPQVPLYSSNQNTYFLHGLARNGPGLLSQDWLARTRDPVPVFSALVDVTARVLGEHAFYVYHAVIAGIYAYGLLGIASFLLGAGNKTLKLLCCFVPLAAIHAGLIPSTLSAMGFHGRGSILEPGGPLVSGVAGQYILGPVFQPSVFGTFLLLSIHEFLRGRPRTAAVCLAIATTFHPTYFLCAGVLAVTYMAIVFREQRSLSRAIQIGALTLLLATPALAYSAFRFDATTAELAHRAREILVDYRIPHHAKPASWFRGYAPLQVALVALSLVLVRRTSIFSVLLPSLVVALILTLVEVATGNEALALLFPWRASVFLVPIASTILIACLVAFLFRTFGKTISNHAAALTGVTLIAVALIGVWGARSAVALFNAPPVGRTPAVAFVARTARPGDQYLIPPEMHDFRVAARVPVFIDSKSHPYKDVEVLEWFTRDRLATDFYRATPDVRCSKLRDMTRAYRITHVVMKTPESLGDCAEFLESYRDGELTVYAAPANGAHSRLRR